MTLEDVRNFSLRRDLKKLLTAFIFKLTYLSEKIYKNNVKITGGMWMIKI